MFGTLRNRLFVILGLVALCVFYLVPREVTVRERDASGRMRDTTMKRVPLKQGLDLRGGVYLALELDQSKRVSANPAEDIERALQVLRKRVDEFGVEEHIIQKSGDDRIVVELAGLDDPARAKAVVQRSAFLEFQITDKAGAFERALPSMDRALRQLGVSAGPETRRPSAVEELLGGDTTRARAATDSAAADSVVTGGALSSLIQSAGVAGDGGVPGEFVVS
jgi:preprotein translocase subunit SecD